MSKQPTDPTTVVVRFPRHMAQHLRVASAVMHIPQQYVLAVAFWDWLDKLPKSAQLRIDAKTDWTKMKKLRKEHEGDYKAFVRAWEAEQQKGTK